MTEYKDDRKKSRLYSDDYRHTEAGYLYIVSSPTFKDFIKVGKTTDLKKRIIGYNSSTPHSDFRYINTTPLLTNLSKAEEYIIKYLGETLVAKEWFNKNKLFDAQIALEDAINLFSFNTNTMEGFIDEEQTRKDKN